MAERSGVSIPTVKRLEAYDGDLGGRADTGTKIRAALEAAGVEFTNGGQPGVRLKPVAAGELAEQIGALEAGISLIPASVEPSPEAGMNQMRKAVAEDDLKKLKNRRTRAKGGSGGGG